MLHAIREVQIPLLAAMLLSACVAKLAQVLKAGGLSNAFGPTVLFPVNMRRPVAIGICAIEFSLGLGLILTAGGIGGTIPAAAFRVASLLFFVVATCALIELGPIGLPPFKAAAYAQLLGILAGELLIIGALSPEIGEGLVKLGYSEPCELQTVPSGRTLAALHRSRQWRRHSGLITSTVPADIWRELCWRYVVFPATHDNRPADLVFAVFLKYRRPTIRAALVDARTGQTLPWPETRARRWLPWRAAPVPLSRLATGTATSPATPERADLPVSTDV
jgi:hypothetical protein